MADMLRTGFFSDRVREKFSWLAALLLVFLCPGLLAANGPAGGVTLSGSSGLLTIAIPDSRPSSYGFACKVNQARGSATFEGRAIDLEKDETVFSGRWKYDEEIELALVYLSYDRVSLPELSGSASHTGIGVKVTPKDGEKDFCYGFTYAPMNTFESMLADIEQIESLRNVYATFADSLTANLTGYLNLSAAFAGKQKIVFSDGSRRDVDRNDIYTGSFGLEYRLRKGFSAIAEWKIGHYREMMSEDTVRYRFHGGLRFSGERYGIEISAYNLNDADPVVGAGGVMNF